MFCAADIAAVARSTRMCTTRQLFAQVSVACSCFLFLNLIVCFRRGAAFVRSPFFLSFPRSPVHSAISSRRRAPTTCLSPSLRNISNVYCFLIPPRLLSCACFPHENNVLFRRWTRTRAWAGTSSRPCRGTRSCGRSLTSRGPSRSRSRRLCLLRAPAPGTAR